MSLMSGVFDIIEDVLSKNQVHAVTQVRLVVGELTNAEPEALKLAFAAYAKDTQAEGAALEIVRVPVLARCRHCRQEFPVSGLTFLCPHCRQSGLEIIQGEELMLESLEVE
jgi:hydrogenase nickel incorporation protein HypA/HybF